jgi:hypothetical protein
MLSFADSEQKLQRKLNVPGCADVSVPLSKCRTRDIGVERSRTETPRLADKDMLVPGIEELGLETHSHPLGDRNVFNDADVLIGKSRSPQRTDPRTVAEVEIE